MIDRETVIKGLECIAQTQAPSANPCKGCAYIDRPNFAICVKDIATDTLALLEERDELLDRALQILDDNESDTPCIAMHGSSFCEDFCNVGLLDCPKKECWLHYLEMKK